MIDEGVAVTTGTVKWFSQSKGYGFITPDDGSSEAFVHISGVVRAGLSVLEEGQRLEYDIEQGRNGKSNAVNLRVAE